ncbi:hypothetical protein AB1Y20_005114 [Prymnesium parvum]|uniref:Non-specific serine/threonine protein kinase n=1 Tax=Prymnesium parvum TaxID=97485 RepID=A0AB34J5L0_PRYPA
MGACCGHHAIKVANLSKGVLADKYDLRSHILGRGSFAVVQVAVDRQTGMHCACKIISKWADVDPEHPEHGKPAIDSWYLNQEVEILRKAGSHPNILEVYDVYETSSCVYVVLELAQGGSLLDVIKRLGAFTERDAASAVRQVAAALGYLHEHGIVHRDIKMANLLVEDRSSFVIKVSDFGLSKSFTLGAKRRNVEYLSETDRPLLMKSACGSAAYAAPELFLILIGDEDYGTEGTYDQSVDVWGLGICMCVLVSGRHPLDGVPKRAGYELMRTGRLVDFRRPEWQGVSTAAKDLIMRMLAFLPGSRILPDQILSDPWVSGDIAPSTPLPHVLEGAGHLRLQELQKLVLQVMETHVESGLEDIDRLFAELETNGYIHRATLQAKLKEDLAVPASKKLGIRLHDLDICFDKLDLGGTGVITLHEFRAAALAQRQHMLHALLEPVFVHFDLDQSGQLKPSELVKVFAQIGIAEVSEEQVADMMKAFDINHSGTLTYEEFQRMVMSFERSE